MARVAVVCLLLAACDALRAPPSTSKRCFEEVLVIGGAHWNYACPHQRHSLKRTNNEDRWLCVCRRDAGRQR